MDRTPKASQDHSGVVVPPPLIYLVFFLVGMGLERYRRLPRLLSVGLGRTLGALLVLSWLVLTMWSFRRFWAFGTSVIPVRPTTALVMEGPYRFTRNPMYLGLLMLYAGVACWFGLVWPLLLAPGLVWIVAAWVIGREERYLKRKFGQEYRQYRARVRRWL
jgi:protein-S-isoprenylcysteine O-methyltransferase Ste14